MLIFLDANIIFSASRPESLMRKFIFLLVKNGHRLVANDYAREEALRNIIAKQFASLNCFHQLFEHITVANILSEKPVEGLQEKDQPIALGAIGTRSDYLLTSDKKDFGSFMGNHGLGVEVGTPEMLAGKLQFE